mgnify:CR=1 FL=1
MNPVTVTTIEFSRVYFDSENINFYEKVDPIRNRRIEDDRFVSNLNRLVDPTRRSLPSSPQKQNCYDEVVSPCREIQR